MPHAERFYREYWGTYLWNVRNLYEIPEEWVHIYVYYKHGRDYYDEFRRMGIGHSPLKYVKALMMHWKGGQWRGYLN